MKLMQKNGAIGWKDGGAGQMELMAERRAVAEKKHLMAERRS